jgi:hypothetical protein
LEAIDTGFIYVKVIYGEPDVASITRVNALAFVSATKEVGVLIGIANEHPRLTSFTLN